MMKELNTIEVSEKANKQVAVTITYKKDEIILGDNGSYTTVDITGGFPLGRPGQPSLPWRRFYVSVPLGAVVNGVNVENLQVTLLAEGVIVDPIQRNVPLIPGTILEWTPPDSELYASTTVWPEVFVQLRGIRYTGGLALAEIEVCPFRYHLPSKRLELIERLNLLLQYRDAETTVEKPYSLVALKHERKFAERVRAMVLNPEDVSRYQQFKEGEIFEFRSPPKVLPEVNYVIITSSALSKSFEKLATWRHRLGLRAKVVRVEDIKGGSVPDTKGKDGKNAIFWHTSGYHDGGTRDKAEMIRNFIQWASVNWSTDYVLLGGDTEIIPCRQAMQSADNPGDQWDGFNMFKYFTKVDDPDFQFQNDHPINLAKYAPSASSAKPNHPPANVTDENPNTSWQCDASDGNPWITVELFDPHTPVNYVKTDWEIPPVSYTIAVSHDQSHWTDVYSTSSTAILILKRFCAVSAIPRFVTNCKLLLL